jgi:hypothetical protein
LLNLLKIVQISFQRDATLSSLYFILYRMLSVVSRWKLIYTKLVMHGTMNVKSIKNTYYLQKTLRTKFMGVFKQIPQENILI